MSQNDVTSVAEGLAGMRIADAGSSSPAPFQTKMYRYDSEELVEVIVTVDGEQDYVAISHVWGAAEWLRIPGPGPGGQLDILASKEKAHFISEVLPKEIGDGNIFWMDILCVDQKNKAARIAVTQNIPDIYRFASSTLVVRESQGFQKCCATALKDDVTDLKKGTEAIAAHHFAVHRDIWFNGGILTRLWPLQEALLSDHIRFVQCVTVKENVTDERLNMQISPPALNSMIIFRNLFLFTDHWALGGGHDDLNALRGKFILAYMNCEAVRRVGATRPPTKFSIPLQEYLVLYMSSSRKTSKPRDFILAVMPQFEFYTVPPNAREMTFGQLFLDCSRQMEAVDSHKYITPLFIAEINARSPEFTATDDIPEPDCLGDLMKLFLGARPRLHETPAVDYPLGKMRLYPAQARLAQEFVGDDHRSALFLIIQAIRDSITIWSFASDELQDNYEDFDEEFLSSLQQNSASDQQVTKFIAMTIFSVLIRPAFDSDTAPAQVIAKLNRLGGFKTMVSEVSPYDLVLIAAVISCGLGFSAIEWARRNLVPLFVTFHGRSFLALARVGIAYQAGLEYFMVETETFLWFDVTPSRLLARHPEASDIYHVCLFPQVSNSST